nr:hypothetical protein Itr_chr12CG10830 [Ipomoea trifida]
MAATSNNTLFLVLFLFIITFLFTYPCTARLLCTARLDYAVPMSSPEPQSPYPEPSPKLVPNHGRHFAFGALGVPSRTPGGGYGHAPGFCNGT